MTITVLRLAKPNGGNSRDWFRCACGREETARTSAIKSGKITACRACVRDNTNARRTPCA